MKIFRNHDIDSKILDAFANLRKVTISFVMYFRPSERNNSVPIGRIFHEICYLSIFGNSVEKIQVSLKSDKNEGCVT